MMRRIIFLNKIFLFLLLIAAKQSVAATITVCGSGCDYTTIQAGIDNAISGDVVSVSAGTYSENITFAAAEDNITVQGAGSATTLIQGVPGVDSRVVIFSSANTTSLTVLDGFTVDNQHFYDHTGGILVTGGASPTLRNLKVSGNSLRNSGADHFGGGIKVVDSGVTIISSVIGGLGGGNGGDRGGGGIYATSANAATAVVIINTEISYNSTEGGGGGINASNYAGTVTISDSLISYNTNTTVNGGGVICRNCALMELINTDVDNNSNTGAFSTHRGGGIAVGQGGVVTFTNGSISGNFSNRASGGINVQGVGSTFTANRCKISGNRAGSNDGGGGISIFDGASTTLTNCMITGNTTGTNTWSSGGGVLVVNGSAVIDHCTVSGNWSNKTGGGVDSGAAGTTTITNSLLWGNTSKDAGTWDLFQSGGPITTVHYSAVGSGQNYAGSNNITAITGTVFVFPDPATGSGAPKITGDYHLMADAVEAINTADPLSTVTEDFDGEFRPAAGRNDMGADETAGFVANTPPVGGYIVDNLIPAEQVTQSSNGDGIVTVNWKGRDDEANNVMLNSFQYSIDGGTFWNAPLSGDLSSALSADWDDNGGSNWTTAITLGSAAPHSFSFDTNNPDLTGMANLDLSTVQVRFRLRDVADSISYVTSESFRVDNQAPTPSYTSATYISSTDTITISGTQFTTLGDTAAEIKNQVDWSKFSWDIDGDSETTDVGFAVSDVTSLIIDSDTSMTLVLTSAKATAIEGMANYAATGGEDTLDFTVGFSVDAAGNVSTTDAAANVPLYISESPALIVTKSEDTDGTCTVLDCSLREAVKAANADPGASIIEFLASTNGSTIAITRAGADDTNVNGDFDITSPVYIVGNGSASTLISGGLADRVFHITNASAATIDGVKVHNGTLSGDGGCIYTTSEITIRDSIVDSCTANGSNGGAIYSGGAVIIDNSTISNSAAGNNGGAIFTHGMTVTNGTFQNNSASDDGGAIANLDNLLTITGTIFDGNRAGPDLSDFGGSIYSSGSLTISSSTFTGRNDGAVDAYVGGAIYLLYPENVLTLSDSSFSSLVAFGSAGAILMHGGTINNVTFTDNEAQYDDGGAIRNSTNLLTVTGATFDGNRAGPENGDFGGAIFSSGSLTISNTTFTGRNDGTVDAYVGGAIYLLYPENMLTLSDSSFSSLVAFGSAGAIFMHGGTISNVIFTDNDAQYDDGGAIKNITNLLTITDTVFDGNRAGPENGDFGGSIFSSGSLAISNATFTGRNDGVVDAFVGGAIYLVDADDTLTLSDSSFSSFIAYGSAGAIRMNGGTISNVIFTDNHAQYDDGGAIKNITNLLTITETVFDGNRAGPVNGDFGGSIFSSGSLTISNATFAGPNDGAVDAFSGGAIYGTGLLNVTNSTFSANRAAARGGAIFQFADATITNATIYNSTAGTGGEAIYTSLATVTLENTIVAKSDASSNLCTGVISNDHNLQYNGTCFTAAANDISGQDPLLGALADNGGFTQTHALLSSSSPAVDKGLDATCAAAPVNNLDQRGVSRPIDGDAIPGAVCDIGAYEYAVADDPDHFLISHDSHGIYCGANEVVTVTPKDIVSGNYPRYSKTIVLDTQTGKGDWALSSGAGVFSDATANDGLATYTFTGSESSASFALTYQEGDSALDIDVYEQANNTIRDDDTEGVLTYLPSGFTITNSELFDPTILPDDITTKNQDTDFTIHLTAYGTTANDATCGVIEGYTGTKSLKFWSSASGVFTIDTSAIAATEGVVVGQDVNFTDGKAQITGNYDSTGSISFNMKDDAVTEPNLPTGILGESNLFDVNAATLPWNTCDHEATPFACFNFYSLSDFSPLGNTIQGTVGVAGTYSGSSMTLQNMGSQEFVLLVGGDATIGSGTQSGDYEGGKQDVGGDITYTGGAVLNNDVHSGGSITAVSGATNIDGSMYAATNITEADGSFNITGTQNPGTAYTPQLDFTVVSDYFKTFSTTTGASASTTVTTDSFGALSTEVVSGDNFTSVDATTLLNAHQYTVTGPCDAVLYINVTGSTTPTINSTSWVYSGGIDKSHVLLNFPNATTLTLSSGNMVNMLAPYATATALDGWVQGNLIVGNMIDDSNVRLGHFTPAFDTCPPLGALNYFQISHDEAGIHCSPETITVTPKQSDGNDFIGYTGTIVLDTQEGTGIWSTSASGAFTSNADGTATYTFTGLENSVAFNLDYKSGNAAINIAVHDESDPSLKDDDAEGDLIFSASGFTVTRDALNDAVDPIVINSILTQTAGTPFDMHITAYGTTATDQTCGVIETYVGEKNLDFWVTRNNPADGTVAPTVDGTTVTAAAGDTQIAIAFTSGRAVVPINYKDVGQITIDLLDASASMVGASQFVVRPADLVLSNILMPTTVDDCGNGDDMTIVPPDPEDHTNEQTFDAGENFCVTVTALDSEGTVTPNFGQEGESIKLTSTMVAAGGDQVNPPIMAPTGFTFNAGAATSSDISWGEVGIIRLSASIGDGNYLGTGDVTGTTSDSIGRFVPANFSVVTSRAPEFKTACGGFTYIGQPFEYVTKPELTVTARNASGATTRNYTGDWFKLVSTSFSEPIYSVDLPRTLDTVPNPAAPAINDLGEGDLVLGGQATVVLNSDPSLAYVRALPIEPFDASIDFSVQIKDEDGVEASEYPFIIPSVVFDSGASMVYGRVKIGNALGSELLDLNMPVVVERYSTANVFEPNDNDSCTELTLGFLDPDEDDGFNVPVAGATPCVRENLTNYNTSGLSCTDPVATLPSYSEPPTDGDFNVWLTAPGVTGSLDLTTIDLDDWLMFDWNGDANNDQPQGRASFGVYRGNDSHIFLREVY